MRDSGGWLAGAALAATLALRVEVARAQDQTPSPRATTESQDAANATDKALEQLILPEGASDEDDIKWLYSDAEEYAPSGLVGDAIRAPGLPERGEGSRRTWDPRWRRFGFGNYVLTGTALAVAAGSFVIPTSSNPWRGKIGFDESVRDAIGIQDYESGQWSRDVSDIVLSVEISYPLLVDSLVVTYGYRRSEDVAGQMALITTETLGVAAAVQGLVSGFTSRERPYGRNCDTGPNATLDDCEGNKRYRSFFSGHTTLSFAGAAVSCSHHIRHDVFGDSLADALSCGTAFAAASVGSTMRIVGDQHYASDVVVGAAFGTLTGFGVPWLLHYGPLARHDVAPERAASVRLTIVPVSNGMGVGGMF
jgi:hypothetical protein